MTPSEQAKADNAKANQIWRFYSDSAHQRHWEMPAFDGTAMMFGSLLRKVKTVVQIVFALSILLSVQAQAQSLVGAWTTQGRDWVWFFLANGQTVLVGTGVNSLCSGVSTKSGTYTNSAGSLMLVGDPSYGCNGDVFPKTSGTITANYTLSGTTLTLNNISSNEMGISTIALTQQEAQTQSILGTWNTQGSDNVWNFQANGQYVLTGTNTAPHCPTTSTVHGTYSAVAEVFSVTKDTWTCNGVSFTGVQQGGSGMYALNGNTLTLFVFGSNSSNVAGAFGLMLNPQSGTSTTITATTPLPPPPITQTVFTVPTGQMPTAAVSVSATGTFGNATLVVTLDLSKVLSGGSFAGQGQFAAGYNVYVAALAPSGTLGLPTATWFVLPATHNWTLLSSPIAAYLTGLAQNATNPVQINILQGLDVTGLVGAEIYIGYGTSDTEMFSSNRYRGVYKVQ